MDQQWGPYLTERAWGTGLKVREDATYQEACSSGNFLDGIFGFGNASGTVKASFAFWNGQDSHLKERLFDQRERYLHGLADPHYQYCSCRYIYPQDAFPYNSQQGPPSPGPAFDLNFELAKVQSTRLFYRLTVTNNCGANSEDATAYKPAELTVAAQLWVCHAGCGRVERLQGTDCLRVSAANTCCCGPSCCCHLDASGQQKTLRHYDAKTAINYRLHYQPADLATVAFSGAASPGVLNRLIVHGDASGLHSDGLGSRAALVYRLSVPASGSVSLCFLLDREEPSAAAGAEDPPPWCDVPDLMRRAAQLASELLAAAAPDELSDDAKRVSRRAYASILWNRQLCSVEAPQSSAVARLPCLMVVPDKWHRPAMASWEHALHAIVLCRVSCELATAELRHQLARMSVSGEFAWAKAAPPVWPLALLELLQNARSSPVEVGSSTSIRADKEAAERIFIDLLRHLNWWLLERTDQKGKNTIEGGILGLEHRGWIAGTHASETNDSLVWSGFFCSKMIHLAAQLQRPELKSLLDLFNAVLSTLHNDSALVGGLFRPRFAGEKRDSPGACGCAFGFAPLLGCASIPWDFLTDSESRVLLDWLHWLSSEVAITTETPSLFVKTNTNSNQFLLSWITETEFVSMCATLFDPAHFLSTYGIRCASRRMSEQLKDQGSCSSCRVDRIEAVSVPLNYLTLEALKCWESVYGQQLQLEYPTGSGMRVCLNEIILDISQRVLNIFLKIEDDAPMFYELYRADNGQGIGSSHTSWSSLIANISLNLTRQPTPALHRAPGMPRVVSRILPKSSVVHLFRQVLRSSIKMDDFAPDSSFDWSADED